MSTVLVFPIIFAVCGSVCYSIAKTRGLSRPFWVVMGSLFGPLAILAILFAKPKAKVAY